MNSFVFRLSMLCLAVCLAGCSGGSNVSVSGLVTMDGSPLADAEVEFFAIEREAGVGGGTTRTAADGKYTLAGGPQLRLRPGKFGVYISKWVDKKTKQAPPAEEMEMQKLGGMLINLAPYKYSNREEAANLAVELKPGKNVDVNFPLTSK